MLNRGVILDVHVDRLRGEIRLDSLVVAVDDRHVAHEGIDDQPARLLRENSEVPFDAGDTIAVNHGLDRLVASELLHVEVDHRRLPDIVEDDVGADEGSASAA